MSQQRRLLVSSDRIALATYLDPNIEFFFLFLCRRPEQ